MMTSEYRDHTIPVAANAEHWDMLIFSAGRVISPMPAITKPYKSILLQLKWNANHKSSGVYDLAYFLVQLEFYSATVV